MKKMALSIIIPAYNEEKYLETTIKSIYNQDFTNYEIIVVCNGCTDNTKTIAKKYAKVILMKNGNVAEARNEGAKKAKGTKLVFLDADTLLIDQGILRTIFKEKAVIGTCFGKSSNHAIHYVIYSHIKNLASLFFGMVNGITFCNRNIFLKVKGYDPAKVPMENHDLIQKIKNYGRFKVLPLYVANSMRRYEQFGFWKQTIFWIKKICGSKEKYLVVR